MKNICTLLCLFFTGCTSLYAQDESVGMRWSNKLMSKDFNIVYDMAVDNEGNVYVAGSTGDAPPQDWETNDMLIAKFDAKGNLIWKDTLQGSANLDDAAYDIAIDKDANIYLAGACHEPYSSGSALIVKYNPSGTRLWKKSYLGEGYGVTSVYARIGLDPAGNIILNTESNKSNNTGTKILTAKISPEGELQWMKFINEGISHSSTGFTVDAQGNSYITGSVLHDGASHGREFTAKYDSTGNLRWLEYPPEGPYSEGSHEVITDINGNVFIISSRLQNGVDQKVVLTKYNASGSLQWRKVKTSNLDYQPRRTGSPGYITTDKTGNFYTMTPTSVYGVSITKYNAAGDELWIAEYNDDTPVLGQMVIDHEDNLYITGRANGGLFLLKYDPTGTQQWVKRSYNSKGNFNIRGYFICTTLTGDVYLASQSSSLETEYYAEKRIVISKYSPSEASVEKSIAEPGTYVFNASGNNTAITITFNTVSGTGTLNVSYFGFPAANLEFDGSQPINISQYKWVIDALGLTGIDAELKIALAMLQNNGGVINPNDVKIFKREIEGSGAFKELATKFENGELKASITGFSEFILGSSTTPMLVQEEGDEVFKTATLFENFPEPFKSSTKIRFSLPHTAFTKLTVHDSFGKEIAVVVNEQLGAGNYYYQFNAENLTSGVYFYTLSADNFTATKKMTFVR